MKTIQEQNKMIAEFMGHTPTLNGVYTITCPHEGIGFHIETMKYHWSWDWLMLVVEKIETLFDNGIDISIFTDGTVIENWRTQDQIVRITAGEMGFENKIEHCYLAVVKFIEWYNNQNSANAL